MGRGQVVRQRTLDPLSQVRILAPQPDALRGGRRAARDRARCGASLGCGGSMASISAGSAQRSARTCRSSRAVRRSHWCAVVVRSSSRCHRRSRRCGSSSFSSRRASRRGPSSPGSIGVTPMENGQERLPSDCETERQPWSSCGAPWSTTLPRPPRASLPRSSEREISRPHWASASPCRGAARRSSPWRTTDRMRFR